MGPRQDFGPRFGAPTFSLQDTVVEHKLRCKRHEPEVVGQYVDLARAAVLEQMPERYSALRIEHLEQPQTFAV